MSDKPTILDSEDTSVSVAEARHMARKNMLLSALDQIFEMGMNADNKPLDRYNCLKFVVEFASEAQGSGAKTVGRLSPAAARLIAKLGLKDGKTVEGSAPGDRSLPPDETKGERVGGGGADHHAPDDDPD
jgi:hypothetical protein